MLLHHTYQIPHHVNSLYYPAFLALAMRLPACKALRFDLAKREITFELEIPDFSALDVAQVGKELRALADLHEGYENPSCPCGCGAVIIFNACFTLDKPVMGGGITEDEYQCLLSGRKIEAIKSIRMRTGLGLREAKDIADQAYQKMVEEGQIKFDPQARHW